MEIKWFNALTRIGVFAQGQILCISPNGLQAGYCDVAFLAISDQYTTFIPFHKMAAGGHFGWPKITFDRISRHFRSIRNFDFFFFSQNGCQRPFWICENHFRSHFSSFQINTQLLYILFCSQNGSQRPFWMTENHFRSHISPFQINTQLFFKIFFKAASGHFGSPIWAILDDRKSLLNAFLAISDQYATFFFQNGRRRPFWKSDLSHFGWPKITFDRISRHFRSIHNFFFLNFF